MSIAQSDTVKKIRELNDELRQIEHEIDEIERRGLGDLPIDRVPTPTESLGMTLLKKVAAFYVVEALKRFSRDIEEKKYYDRIKLLLHKQQLLLDELAYYQRALRESIPPYQNRSNASLQN